MVNILSFFARRLARKAVRTAVTGGATGLANLLENEVAGLDGHEALEALEQELGKPVEQATEGEVQAAIEELSMPHRDPETGQFVSGGGSAGGAPSYHDLEVQFIGAFNEIDSADAGETNDEGARTEHEFEPAAGLATDELAELVGITYDLTVAAQPNAGDSDTEPGNVNYGVWQSKNRDYSNEFPQDTSNSEHDTDWGLDTNPAGVESDRHGLLDGALAIDTGNFAAYFNDTTNGTGGGSEASDLRHHQVWFRPPLSQGPIFDRDDEVTVRIQQNREVVSAATVVRLRALYYWNIHEGEVTISFR